MTDAHDPDELASAHLDGATSPDEAALVAGDPALQARVEELRAVRDAMQEAPPVDPVRRDAAIEAALAAFDEDAAAAEGAPAAVTPIASRRGISPTAIRVLGAAAVFVLLALLVPLLRNLGDSDDDTASFEATSDAIGGSADAATDDDAGAEVAESPNASTTVPAPMSDAGPAYADLDALAEAVSAGHLAGAPLDSQERGQQQQSAFCPTSPSADSDTEVSTAVVAGEPVIVVVRTAADGTRRLTVLSADGCRVLDERRL